MSGTSVDFVSCAKCARDGAGGAILSHAGCVAAPAVAGIFGVGLSGSFMAAAMYIASPLIAMGVTYGLDRLRKQKTSAVKLAGAALIALTVSFGLNAVSDHDHHAGHEHSDLIDEDATRAWIESLPPETQQILEDAARLQGVSLIEYASAICGPASRPPPEAVTNTVRP